MEVGQDAIMFSQEAISVNNVETENPNSPSVEQVNEVVLDIDAGNEANNFSRIHPPPSNQSLQTQFLQKLAKAKFIFLLWFFQKEATSPDENRDQEQFSQEAIPVNDVGVETENPESPSVEEGMQSAQYVEQVNEVVLDIIAGEEATPPSNQSLQTQSVQKLAEIEGKRRAKRKVILEFASTLILFGFSELLCILFISKNSSYNLLFEAIAILGSLSLISGFCLLFHTFFMLATKNPHIHPKHGIVSNTLIAISVTSLVFALLILLSLLPKPYSLLIPIPLISLFLTLGFHFYLRTKTNDEKTESDQTNYEVQMKDITRLSELSQAVASFSSGGLIGLLFGVYKNASNHAHHPAVLVIICLTFISFVFSLNLMLLCQNQVMHLSSRFRINFLITVTALCVLLLVLLAFAALIIAYMFLKEYIVMVFIPILIVCVVWLFLELCTGGTRNDQETLREEDLKLTYSNAKLVTSSSLGGILAIFGGYLGNDERNMHLNICMIFMASTFLSGLSLMLLSYKASTRPRMAPVISILSCFAISLLVISAFTTAILEFMQLK